MPIPDLSFEILRANPARETITPALAFDLRVTNRFPEQSIQSRAAALPDSDRGCTPAVQLNGTESTAGFI